MFFTAKFVMILVCEFSKDLYSQCQKMLDTCILLKWIPHFSSESKMNSSWFVLLLSYSFFWGGGRIEVKRKTPLFPLLVLDSLRLTNIFLLFIHLLTFFFWVELREPSLGLSSLFFRRSISLVIRGLGLSLTLHTPGCKGLWQCMQCCLVAWKKIHQNIHKYHLYYHMQG